MKLSRGVFRYIDLAAYFISVLQTILYVTKYIHTCVAITVLRHIGTKSFKAGKNQIFQHCWMVEIFYILFPNEKCLVLHPPQKGRDLHWGKNWNGNIHKQWRIIMPVGLFSDLRVLLNCQSQKNRLKSSTHLICQRFVTLVASDEKSIQLCCQPVRRK